MPATTLPLKVALLAVLTACGGSGERPSAADRSGGGAAATNGAEDQPPRSLAQLDACALLPPAEIPARFGAVTEGPTLTRNPNGWPTCSYVLAPNTGLIVELIEASMYDLNRSVWGPGKTEDVAGVGEKAFLVKLKPPADPYLVAAKGDIAVKVATRNLELAREAARTILGKL
jgi:hypothetical protein